MVEMDGLLNSTPELVQQNSNNVYPSPCRRERLCAETTYVPISSDGAASPDKRKRRSSVSPREYRPKSPNPYALDGTGEERPESRYASDVPIGKLPASPVRANKQLRVDGFPTRPTIATARALSRNNAHNNQNNHNRLVAWAVFPYSQGRPQCLWFPNCPNQSTGISPHDTYADSFKMRSKLKSETVCTPSGKLRNCNQTCRSPNPSLTREKMRRLVIQSITNRLVRPHSMMVS